MKFYKKLSITFVNIYNYHLFNFFHHIQVIIKLNSLILKKELKLFNIFAKSLTITQYEI